MCTCLCMCVHIPVYTRTCGSQRVIVGVGSLLLPCGSQGSQVIRPATSPSTHYAISLGLFSSLGDSRATQGHLVSSCLQVRTSLQTSWTLALQKSEGRSCSRLLTRGWGVLLPWFSWWNICQCTSPWDHVIQLGKEKTLGFVVIIENMRDGF